MFTGKGFEELNTKSIFKRITEFDVFNYYIPDFVAINKPFSSPLRPNVKTSCSVQEYQGKLFYKDFGTGDSYDAISFVRNKFQVTFHEALNILSSDFNLGLHSNTIEKTSMGFVGIHHVEQKSVPKETIIRIKRRLWNTGLDKEYWTSFGITKATLSKFNVHPISHLWINNSCFNIKPTNPSYAYVEGEGKYKVLSPYSEHKWVGNCNSNNIQGWEQLPDNGELCIITSSKKDVMLLYELGYSAIAPQSESYIT